ncbi:hypothetical protein AC578_9542 [Pseudocercospora eumusae]|uniref:NAD(P)-binding protein n=1 Tax=Pseudocercospora eumusae TaxID=321146 RepID=A0A139HGF4_9PEZI|nr:hypothetical protein AC578_9542 [Pseudocercospora eumusae]
MAQFFIKDEEFASLKDKVIIVTGGSSGIGLATVKLLLDTGAFVFMGDLQDAPVSHDRLTFVKTDVTSWTALKILFNTAATKHGRIDHVFSNAGIGPQVNYLDDQYDETGDLKEPGTIVYDINLRGMINTSYLGIHYMKKQEPKGGSIVCTASASAFQRFAAWDYTTTKHGVLGWMRGAIPNLAEQNLPIRVNAIGPSWTLTGLVPRELFEHTGIETQEPSVVARQVALLMADKNRTGQFIYSTAGRNYEIEEKMLQNAMDINTLGKVGDIQTNEQLAYEKIKENLHKFASARLEEQATAQVGGQ